MLCVGTPEREDGFAEGGWWFEAGPQRAALPYSYLIGPDGSFGLAGDTWVPLHAAIEGWIESLALAYAAQYTADTVTRVSGNAWLASPIARGYGPGRSSRSTTEKPSCSAVRPIALPTCTPATSTSSGYSVPALTSQKLEASPPEARTGFGAVRECWPARRLMPAGGRQQAELVRPRRACTAP